MLLGGVDTGWTFYTPYSTTFSNTHVMLAAGGVFIAGFSSILTGLNFIVTMHTLRAPGMTWFRLPLFVWSLYATSVILVLATPVLAITLLLLVVERVFGSRHLRLRARRRPAAVPAPVLVLLASGRLHHDPAGMGVISELIACFARRPIFGYRFVALASVAIAVHRLPGVGPSHVRAGQSHATRAWCSRC